MKKIISFIVVIVIVGGASFYVGTVYKNSSKSNASQTFGTNMMGGQNFTNLSSEERTKMMQERGGGVRGVRGAGMGVSATSTFISGEIISKDEESITVKLTDGGSAIVYVASSTVNITKPTKISLADLQSGDTVIVGASKNTEGTYTAESVRVNNITTTTNK